MRRSRFLPLLLVPFVVASCFPIELDVSSDGKLIIPRAEGFFTYDPATGKTEKVLGNEMGAPVFARYSPNKKDLLAVTKSNEGFNAFQFLIVPLAGGKPKPVFKGENTAYVRFSPDGDQLAISKGSDKDDPDLKERVPEVHLVSLKDGKSKVAVRKVGVLVRWFPDSKRLLVFSIQKKDENSKYYGNLATLDIATGKTTNVCSAVSDQQVHLDLSPDGKTACFTAYSAGKPGADLPAPESFEKLLFLVDIASGKLTDTKREASYAIFSPDSKNLLIGAPAGGFSFDTLKLEVAPIDKLDEATAVTQKAHKPVSFGGGGMFPGWQNNKTVFYFVQKEVYGTEAKSVHLMLVDADGSNRRNAQPAIDAVAASDNESE